MENRYVAIYTKWAALFPDETEEDALENGNLVNIEFSNKKDCLKFFKEERVRVGGCNVWNTQVYDKKLKKYIYEVDM